MPQFERRYIAEYCAERWPEGGYQLNYPLGPIPRAEVATIGYDAAARLYRPYRPEVDAVKFYTDGLVLIESKVMKHWHVLGQLLLYQHLIPYTQELRPYWSLPVTARIIMPEIPPLIREVAESVGIQVERFVTAQILAQQEKYNKYWTHEYQTARQEKMAIRKALGVE
jgi:hypothetical protein